MVGTLAAARKRARQAVESRYEGICTITGFAKVRDAQTNITETKEIEYAEGQPCRLSFSSFPSAAGTETAADLLQSIKLFLAPEIEVPAGCKITVTQAGRTGIYERSGQPAVYATHQEIQLALHGGRA